MPRPKNKAAHTEMAHDIKAIARQQLADKGTNGISLRGIARELGVTAPAIYNYFPKLDDLITALLVDAFTGQALAIEDAMLAQTSPKAQLLAALRVYRQWAVDNPTEFQLIYGNPVPGYQAPREITVPLASRPQELIVRCLIEAQAQGLLTVPPHYEIVPESISSHVGKVLYDAYPEIKEVPNHMSLFYMMAAGISRVHGIVMLEIHQHLGPTIGDVDSFFEGELNLYLEHTGMH